MKKIELERENNEKNIIIKILLIIILFLLLKIFFFCESKTDVFLETSVLKKVNLFEQESSNLDGYIEKKVFDKLVDEYIILYNKLIICQERNMTVINKNVIVKKIIKKDYDEEYQLALYRWELDNSKECSYENTDDNNNSGESIPTTISPLKYSEDTGEVIIFDPDEEGTTIKEEDVKDNQTIIDAQDPGPDTGQGVLRVNVGK